MSIMNEFEHFTPQYALPVLQVDGFNITAETLSIIHQLPHDAQKHIDLKLIIKKLQDEIRQLDDYAKANNKNIPLGLFIRHQRLVDSIYYCEHLAGKSLNYKN